MPRTEVYCCSTLLSAVTAAVAAGLGPGTPAGAEVGVESGVAAGVGPDGAVRRVLLVADYAPEAEAGTPLPEREGSAGLLALFDLVVDLNQLIAPHHPGGWSPGADAAPLLGRLLRERWELGDQVSLVVEPYQLNFARWLPQLFPDAPLTVVADGLMAYGPSRRPVPARLAARVRELVHLDLVPGLVPVYLSEHGVPARPVPSSAVRRLLDGLAADRRVPVGTGSGTGGALVLGQYLSALHILTPDEEEQLYLEAVLAAGGGARPVAFKPHPAASPLSAPALRDRAAEHGVALELLPASGPAELLFASGRWTSVHGCFSTGLFTASTLYGLPATASGTELLLERLTPYQNSNRIPVTLADRLLGPGGTPPPDPGGRPEVGALVRAVSYCMQSALYPELRDEAGQTLAAYPQDARRYVKRRRLTALGLPGGRPAAAGPGAQAATERVRTRAPGILAVLRRDERAMR